MNKNSLTTMIDQNLSTRKIAAHLGVSQSTIKHWLKRYNLKTKQHSIKLDPFINISLPMIQNIIQSSKHFVEVFKRLNVPYTSRNMVRIKVLCVKNNISIIHMPKICGRSGAPYKIPLNEILVENSTYGRQRLKKRLIEAGLLKNECECGQGPIWNGKPLTIQLDHINGKKRDHRLHNLRMKCPNCHTQTDTYGSKNIKLKNASTRIRTENS